jgi:hypothetical protein
MLGPSDTFPVFVFLCTFLSFYCLQASNANTHRQRASRRPRSIPGVCVWACVWVEASACTWLMLGSCSGLRLAPCLCVSLYFLEVLCLGLCLGFYVWACVSFTPWSLCLGLCLGGSRGLHLAHARLMLGFGILPCLCVSLYFLEVLCLGLCLGIYVWLVFLCTPGVCVWACVWVEASASTWLMLGSCSGLRIQSPSLCFFVPS